MKRSIPFVLVVVAACGPKPSAKTPPVDNGTPTAASGLPAHYAALFQPGNAWSYTLVATDDSLDDQGKPVHQGSTTGAHCRVVSTTHFTGGAASQLTCDYGMGPDDQSGQDPLQGIWVANATGLYRLGSDATMPADGVAPDLTGVDLVIAAVPAAKKTPLDTDDQGGQGGEIDIEQKGDAWCWTWDVLEGDESYDNLCFTSAGVSAGGWGWSGGSSHDVKFTLKK